ncbi:hypothetical protein ABEW62_002158 [Salmonella enterica]
MSTISKERLIKIQQWRETYGPGSNVVLPAEEAEELARIALASLEAQPAIHRWRRVTSEPYGPYPWHYGDFIGFSKPVDGIEDEYFYSAPPEPANAEPVAWLWSHRKHPSEVSLVRPEDDERAEGAHWSGWSCQALYAATPAPVSVPAAMEMDDDFDSAFEHGKAVGWNAYRAAMLQGAEPVTTDYKLRDAVEIIRNSGIEIDAEKILAERDALNSPVIPDGWKLVPVEPTEEMITSGIAAHFERSQTQIHDRPAPGPMECAYVAMLAAAPQQEA